jgi:YgiT-type zinc finger domain-containing protein
MQPLSSTYTTWLEGNLVVLSNVDGWLCDVCGDFVYDPEAIARAELLLGSSARAVHDDRGDSAGQQSHNASSPTLNRGRAS